ncbi:MAG: L-2-amino-thiazoline-4-carboxylic acid hydrolase, partial [Candidatus Hodarchaeota archaeon]
KEILAEQTRKAWAAIAAREKSSFDDLIRRLWEDWTEGEFTIEKSEKGVQIYCTKCPIADSYRSIGKQALGLIFQCSEDPYIAAGFNPNIEFRRSKTLMNGDDCCDHYYSIKQ